MGIPCLASSRCARSAMPAADRFSKRLIAPCLREPAPTRTCKHAKVPPKCCSTDRQTGSTGRQEPAQTCKPTTVLLSRADVHCTVSQQQQKMAKNTQKCGSSAAARRAASIVRVSSIAATTTSYEEHWRDQAAQHAVSRGEERMMPRRR